jgi:hypothetical protein
MATALLFSATLPAQETAHFADRTSALTLSGVVKDLEDMAGKLSEERSAAHANASDTGMKPIALNPDKTMALREISGCLIKRNNLLRNQSTPSDPYYQAIQRQRRAEMDLEILETWWKHCRKGTSFEPLTELGQLTLAAELKVAKEKADKSVAEQKPQPAQPDPDNPDLKPIHSSFSSRIKGDKGILDQIDGWKDQSADSKSKIISR